MRSLAFQRVGAPKAAPLARAVAKAAGPGPVPAPTINSVGFTGDSISVNGGYGAYYHSLRSDKTWTVNAQASRITGKIANLNDSGNTLMGHLSEILMTNAPQLVGGMIGANDMSISVDWPGHKADLITLYQQYKAANPNVLVFWCPTLPYNRTNGSFATFLAREQASIAAARDPAEWQQWCDFVIPIGAHPLFLQNPNAVYFGDTVHPNWLGQFYLRQSYQAGLETLFDYAARANSTQIYSSAWLGDVTDAPTPGEVIERFMYLSGLNPKGVQGTISVTGGDAQISVGIGSYSNSFTGWLYNGDQIGVRQTAPAAGATVQIQLTILGETRTLSYTTQAASPYVARFDPASASTAATSAAWLRDFNRSMSGPIAPTLSPQRARGDVALTNPTGYVEFTWKHGQVNISRVPRVGLVNAAASLSAAAVYLGTTAGTFAITNGNTYTASSSPVQFNAGLNGANRWDTVDGAVVGLLVHKATGKAWFRHSTGWYPDTPTFNPDGSLASGTGFATGLTDFFFAAGSSDQSSLTVNAGRKPFVHDAAIPANVVKGWA